MKYIKGVFNEMKEVTWPTSKEINKYTIASLLMIVIFALYFALTDGLSTRFIEWLVSLG